MFLNCIVVLQVDFCGTTSTNRETMIKPINDRYAAMGKKYYAVAVGHKPGVYTTWYHQYEYSYIIRLQCKLQVDGYPGARFKGFATKTEAEEFVKKNKSLKRPAETALTMSNKKFDYKKYEK